MRSTLLQALDVRTTPAFSISGKRERPRQLKAAQVKHTIWLKPCMEINLVSYSLGPDVKRMRFRRSRSTVLPTKTETPRLRRSIACWLGDLPFCRSHGVVMTREEREATGEAGTLGASRGKDAVSVYDPYAKGSRRLGLHILRLRNRAKYHLHDAPSW